VLDAIRASGAMTGEGAIDISTQAVGIWGRTVALDAPLAEGDRVEIYRPLRMDPKEARRRRAQRRK
jgi:putative ubiquitin-RnfH superfamily antitoxin RatB of RatAB toxin-antitoxin module